MEGNWNGALGQNKYQYNGKEWNDDFGLGLNAYGFRMYDPAVGRWWVQEPLADYYHSITPYNYCFNNPINYIDPLGLDTFKPAPNGVIPNWPNFSPEKDNAVLPPVVVNGKSKDGKSSSGSTSNGNAEKEAERRSPTSNSSTDLNYGTAYNDLKITNGLINLGASVDQTMRYYEGDRFINGYWQDKKGTYRSMRFNGNQYTGGRIAFGKAQAAKSAKIARVTAYAGFAFATIDAGKAYYFNDTNRNGVYTKAVLDATMTAIGLWGGPIGLGVSAVYFMADTMGALGTWGTPSGINEKGEKY